MKANFSLYLAGRRYDRGWFVDNKNRIDQSGIPDFAHSAFKFCSDWLAGKNTVAIRSSGSTGPPKVITVSRQQIMASVKMTAEKLALTRGGSALVCLSCEHVGGLMMLARGLHLELTLYLVKPARNPLAELPVDSVSLDFTAVAPLQLQTMLADRSALAKLNMMKAILVGGAPVSHALQKQMLNVTTPVYQTFGMTETVSHIAVRRLNGENATEDYQILPGVEIAQDQRNCLKICGQVTNGKWVTTNDVVHMTNTRRFQWLGRFDNVINSGGFKVHPEKVEHQLSMVMAEFGLMNRFFVAGLPDEQFAEKVVVIIEGEPLSRDLRDKILSGLSGQLHKYERPRQSFSVRKFIRAANGKINRRLTLKEIAISTVDSS